MDCCFSSTIAYFFYSLLPVLFLILPQTLAQTKVAQMMQINDGGGDTSN